MAEQDFGRELFEELVDDFNTQQMPTTTKQ
jgi:hypothetical protein